MLSLRLNHTAPYIVYSGSMKSKAQYMYMYQTCVLNSWRVLVTDVTCHSQFLNIINTLLSLVSKHTLYGNVIYYKTVISKCAQVMLMSFVYLLKFE